MHGYGIMSWPDGKQYMGQFVYGVKEGQGIHIWEDGKKYDGQWKNGL